MNCVWKNGDMSLWEYKPTFMRPFSDDLKKTSAMETVRFLLEYLHKGKYVVYYLFKEEKMVSRCIVLPGGRRLKRSTTHDIVVGPYYVPPDYRGNGYAKLIIGLSLRFSCYSWENAYVYIYKSNRPSIAASSAVGFITVAEMSIEGPLHRIVEKSDGTGKCIIRMIGKKEWLEKHGGEETK